MKITIRREDFVQLDACEDVLAVLDAIAAEAGGWSDDGTATIWWDWVAEIWARVVCREQVEWAVERRLLPRWDLSGADLRGANLSGADLSGADLRYADLRHADLRHADLFDADLSGANLSGANLFDADLDGADLSDANLSGANLSNTNLSEARNVDRAIGLPGIERSPEEAMAHGLGAQDG